VGADSASALIAWAGTSAGNTISGRRVFADGTLAGTADGFVISGAAGRKLGPSVAWDGSQYWVDWLDHRNDAYPDQPQGDVFTARVAADGTVIDPGGVAVASTEEPEENPTVVAADGQAIHAYSAFTPDAPFASHRIALRRSPFAGTGPAFVVAGAFADRTAPPSLTFVFSDDVAGAVSAENLSLVNLTSGQTVPADRMKVTYDPASRTAVFTFPGYPGGVLPDGNYEATLTPTASTPSPAPALAPQAMALAAAPAPAFSLRFFVLSGDANHDGRVNALDLITARRNLGRTGALGPLGPAQGDVNYDGKVDLWDLLTVRRNFGKKISPPAA
jgi:hypothetical protein